MLPCVTFEISQELIRRGISEIKKEGDIITVFYNGSPIKFDIQKSWLKTIQVFQSIAQDCIADRELIQATIVCLDENFYKLQVDTCKSDDTKLPIFEANNPDCGFQYSLTEFQKNIMTRDISEFIINTIKRTVKHEDILIRQVFYTGLSSYTFDPVNLGVVAPTSEGKTYVVTQVTKYFPKDDVWNIGSMSTKVLVRQKGIEVDRNNEPVRSKLIQIRKRLRLLSNSKADLEIKEKLLEEREKLLEDSKTLIDLSKKILVFLEPPHYELWNLLKPILSHDLPEIEYPYVEKSVNDGLVTKKVIVRGYPACIFCSAKDESKWEIWPEIQSRFLITSPNMNREKYFESNILIGQRKGLPNLLQEHVVVSDREIGLAKTAISILKEYIIELYKSNNASYDHNTNAVWIPYHEILATMLESNKGTDNRTTNRIFSFLNIIPLAKMLVRSSLIFGTEKLMVATLEDLDEVLHITQNVSGIPTHKIQFYREIFIPLYSSKTEVDVKEEKQEKRLAVTTSQLCEFYKTKTGRSLTTNNLKQTYLNELINNGYIDEEDSDLDKRAKIYFPLISIEEVKITNRNNLDAMDNLLHSSKIVVPEKYNRIPKNWLILEILTLWKYPVKLDKFELFDAEANKTCICQFVKKYQEKSDLNVFFKTVNNESIYTETFGNIQFIGNASTPKYENLSIESKLLQNDIFCDCDNDPNKER